MKKQVIFTIYEREECADGVVTKYEGTVDGISFNGDGNSIDGDSVVPVSLENIVTVAFAKEMLSYPRGIRQPVTVEIEVGSGSLWIDSVGYVNTPDQCKIAICDHDPKGDQVPSYWDKPQGFEVSPNRRIFHVKYSTDTLTVFSIIRIDTEEGLVPETSAAWDYNPAQYIEVGQMLPFGVLKAISHF